MEATYSFHEASVHGMVYLAGSHARAETSEIISYLGQIQPGIVDGFSYLWGGPSDEQINYVRITALNVRQQLPKALMDGVLSEGIRPDYNEKLNCGGSLGERHFSVLGMGSGVRQGTTSIWVDLSKADAVAFYECVGQIYIDIGLTIIRFEAPGLVMRNSSSRVSAASNYIKVEKELTAYAKRHGGRRIFFIGDPELAAVTRLDGVLVPSRLFHTSLQSAIKYQHRIDRPGVGVGYSYTLAPLIVKDTVASVRKGTEVFFCIDNWDPEQDDLRRFMELDPENRRYLIQESARNARRGGAHFEPPLDSCGGCISSKVVGDPCEVMADDSSEYNAVQCGDIEVIRNAIR